MDAPEGYFDFLNASVVSVADNMPAVHACSAMLQVVQNGVQHDLD
jgi:hypothetical protein